MIFCARFTDSNRSKSRIAIFTPDSGITQWVRPSEVCGGWRSGWAKVRAGSRIGAAPFAVEFEEQQKQAIRIEVQQLAREREDREQKCLQRKDQTRKDLFAAAKSMLDLPLATLTVKEEVRRCPGTEQAAHGPEPAIPCVTAKSFLAARYPLKRPPLRDLFPPQVEA
jgi:hypothetical protein